MPVLAELCCCLFGCRFIQWWTWDGDQPAEWSDMRFHCRFWPVKYCHWLKARPCQLQNLNWYQQDGVRRCPMIHVSAGNTQKCCLQWDRSACQWRSVQCTPAKALLKKNHVLALAQFACTYFCISRATVLSNLLRRRRPTFVGKAHDSVGMCPQSCCKGRKHILFVTTAMDDGVVIQ